MRSTNLFWVKLLRLQSHLGGEEAPSYSFLLPNVCTHREKGRKWGGQYWSLTDQWLTLTVAMAAECLISILCGNAINSFFPPSLSKIPSSFLWHLTSRKLWLAISHSVNQHVYTFCRTKHSLWPFHRFPSMFSACVSVISMWDKVDCTASGLHFFHHHGEHLSSYNIWSTWEWGKNGAQWWNSLLDWNALIKTHTEHNVSGKQEGWGRQEVFIRIVSSEFSPIPVCVCLWVSWWWVSMRGCC